MIDVTRAQIVKDFTRAWAVNDEAHRVSHFSRVEHCGNILNERLGLGYDPKLIMLVAHFHDMYAWDRGNHHLMSAAWVRTTDYKIIMELDVVDRELVALGCEHHRASYTGKFACRFDELMNSADRELPGQVEMMVERAVLYRMNLGMSREEAFAPAVEHIKEKFSEGGYARYPQLYLDAFGRELAKQREDIKNL